MMYLHGEDVPYRVLAIELCSRGFDIWQNYVDAKEMLRSLFVLATNAKKESISSQNVGPHARTAVRACGPTFCEEMLSFFALVANTKRDLSISFAST